MNTEQRTFIANAINDVLQDNTGNRITPAIINGVALILDHQIKNKYPEQEESEDEAETE